MITLKNARAFAYGVSPNKLFDYMAAARPVICSVPGDMAQLVSESGAGLSCEPEDPASLARAVEQLFAMTDGTRTALGLRGKQHIANHYCRESLSAVLVEQLEALIHAGVQARPLPRAA